ncbi:MAG: hypothetical protein CVU53_04215 [Deltaproteobacteria bacterium HGW-Deltaproteobacteria-11]|nr:MAG: hypothetical protein CVU53_04215 [Deltaproteobacteria bacterium HGW-Deltaproteobacteria-11]
MITRPMIPAGAALFLLTLLFTSCSTLPAIRSLDAAGTQAAAERCRRPFLDAPHRFVHAIEAGMPERTMGTVLGVTLFDPPSGIMHSAVLTLEGFVLFEARYDKGVEVYRAVPPFDAPRFGENMIDDIRLIFLAPQGRLLHAGALENGAAACRYEGSLGKMVDVVVRPDDAWEIVTYGDNNESLRRVEAFFVKDRIPEAVELTGFLTVNYKLRLTLISAEPISSEDVKH